jgi:hypothetical protein
MKNLIYIVLGISLLFLAACEKDDPEIPNEEEVITTLTYTLSPQSGGADVVLTFKDLDGDGGNAPEISSGTLAANTVYNGTLTLLNEQESPAESITEEIEEEADEHQFFFETTVNGTTISYDDTDGGGNPIGLKTILSSSAAGSGTLSITLRHEPSKLEPGVSEGNIANAGGETDIEVTFNIDVQ